MSIEELLNDDEFVRELESAETDSDVVALFNSKGVAISAEEVKAIRDENADDELLEDKLEEVAGGMSGIRSPRPISPKNPVVTWIIKKLFGR